MLSAISTFIGSFIWFAGIIVIIAGSTYLFNKAVRLIVMTTKSVFKMHNGKRLNVIKFQENVHGQDRHVVLKTENVRLTF